MIDLIIGVMALWLLVQSKAFWKFIGFCLCVFNLFFFWKAYERGDWNDIVLVVFGVIFIVAALWGLLNGLIRLCDWILMRLERAEREKRLRKLN